jgi:hypothetical protein
VLDGRADDAVQPRCVDQPAGHGRHGPKRLKWDEQLALELKVCHLYRISHSQFLAWSQDDRDKAIWSYAQERATCPGCGTREDEWLGPDGKPVDAYQAHKRLCRGCRALDHAHDDKEPAGTQWSLRRVDGR